MNRFRAFTDDELTALGRVMDTFAPEVAAYQEPYVTLVHEYVGEVSHRRNAKDLRERRRQRDEPVPPITWQRGPFDG